MTQIFYAFRVCGNRNASTAAPAPSGSGRPAPDEDLFYVPPPGPCYSEGGDIF